MTRDDLPRPDRDPGDEDEYEEEDEDDFSDPDHPDHDLSEWAPYSTPYDPKPWFIRRWVVIAVSVLVIIGLILPFLVRF